MSEELFKLRIYKMTHNSPGVLNVWLLMYKFMKIIDNEFQKRLADCNSGQ